MAPAKWSEVTVARALEIVDTPATRVESLDAPARTGIIRIRRGHHAGVTQLVEYHVANVVVVGSSPITRFLPLDVPVPQVFNRVAPTR